MSDNPTSPAPEPRLAGNLFKLNAIRLLFWTHFISAVLVPFYRDWGGLTFTQILLVNAWFMVWNFLLEVPTGTVADVWGRKASLVLGALIGAGAAIFYVSAPSLPRFLLAEIFFATSFTLMSGADEALLYDTLDDLGRTNEAAKRYGWLAAFQQGGIVIGALLGGVIAVKLGLRAPLALQSLPMLAAAVIALTLTEPERHKATERVGYREVLSVGVRAFFASPALKRLAIDATIVQALAWMIIWLYQPALESAGIPLIVFGAVHTGMSLGQIGLLSNVGRLTTWLSSTTGAGPIGTRRLLRLGPLVVALCFLALGLSHNRIVIVPAIVLCAAFGLARAPLFSASLNHHIQKEQRATVLSTVAMFRTLAIAIANPLAGMLADWSLPRAFLILAAASFLAFLLAPTRLEDIAP
jgi:MFS family permease